MPSRPGEFGVAGTPRKEILWIGRGRHTKRDLITGPFDAGVKSVNSEALVETLEDSDVRRGIDV